jgi:hypothetical protein
LARRNAEQDEISCGNDHQANVAVVMNNKPARIARQFFVSELQPGDWKLSRKDALEARVSAAGSKIKAVEGVEIQYEGVMLLLPLASLLLSGLVNSVLRKLKELPPGAGSLRETLLSPASTPRKLTALDGFWMRFVESGIRSLLVCGALLSAPITFYICTSALIMPLLPDPSLSLPAFWLAWAQEWVQGLGDRAFGLAGLATIAIWALTVCALCIHQLALVFEQPQVRATGFQR